MKKVLFLAAFLPAALLAQNITNTLGVGGNFIVEENSLADAVYINPSTQLFILGGQPVGFTPSLLPISGALAANSASFNLVSQTGATALSIVNLETTGAPAIYLTNGSGSFSSPFATGALKSLGSIHFGGNRANGSNWDLTSASILVTSTASDGTTGIPAKMQFSIKNALASTTATLSGEGTFSTEGALVSQAIRTVTSNMTPTYDDYTIIAESDLSPTITLPSPSISIKGKVYVIKRIGAVGTVTVSAGSSTIDGLGSVAIAADNNVITVQTNGSVWYIISQVP